MKRYKFLIKSIFSAIMISLGTLSYGDSLHVTDDTFSKSESSGNVGSSSGMCVRNDSGHAHQAFLRFDMTPLSSSGTTVTKATVRVFVQNVMGAGIINVHLMTSPWSE